MAKGDSTQTNGKGVNPDWISTCGWFYILLAAQISISCCSANQILHMQGADCGREIELGSATVYSHYRPETLPEYSHSQECKITFKAKRELWKLRVWFEYLDIPDFLYNGVCTDALYMYDSPTTGQRAFRAAGGNSGLCEDDAPPRITSTGRYISVYFRTDTTGTRGSGFKFHISSFGKAADPASGNLETDCSPSDFYCLQSESCIESDLVCDGVNHCTKGEDEENNGASRCSPLEETTTTTTLTASMEATTESSIWQTIMSLGVAGFVGIIVGSLVVVIFLVVCVVCTCRRCGKKPGDIEHRQSIPSSTHGTVSAPPHPQHVVKDGVMYQQVPQAAPMNPHMMQNTMNQFGQSGPVQQQQQQGYTFNQHQLQRPGYVSQQPAMEMQLQPQRMVTCGGGAMPPPQPMPTSVPYVTNYNSPFHLPRAPESHSYSSGYSSQQGPGAGASGFHPMHTKPIISQRGYTPTSGSSRSSRSRSESSVTYNKGDNHQYCDNNRPRAIL